MAARKFRRETRSACLEEDVREMVGVDGTSSDSSRGLAATSTKGMTIFAVYSIFITVT